ncbi:MAG: hypothetical protein J0L87_13850 [Bacteroidetes bacterium]|nr:hypothetical protein [Bacteroidota bacterium]
MKKTLLPLVFLFSCSSLFSQEKQEKEICDCPTQSKVGKGSFYFSWGYNKDWYSKSDIHFTNNTSAINATTGKPESYDFMVHDVAALDRPGFKDILRTDLTIPQYVYRLGYYFNDKKDLGVEINFDHTKYIMRNWQTLRVTGTIHGQAIDQDTLINPDNFLAFEHSDGANFLLFNFMKRQNLLVSKNKKHWLSGVVKIGAGMVIPKTRVQLFGETLDNRFHIAGYCAGVEAGFRYDAFKYVFMEYTAKGVFADYRNVLVIGEGKARHHFWAFENILSVGLQFPI